MKCVVLMFDSLNRRMLPSYGCDWTHAPNFARLARKTLTFDTAYVCSMPCMPARRDLHTGRPNFLHRGWGPLEPWDDSVMEVLKKNGVYTHLVTDHYHYWEDGGANYHNRYSSSEFVRGQEGDLWIGQVEEPVEPKNALGRHAALEDKRSSKTYARQDLINRNSMRDECDMPQPQTFARGMDFIERNKNSDNWLLQIETFDPHEPFFAHRKYKDRYTYDPDAMHFDWPIYRKVEETPEQVEHLRYNYAALVSQCDAQLGDLLDTFDRLDLWQDTMLMVWTDHGFLLGEHDCWAKNWMPLYEEVARTPFFVYDPRTRAQNERRGALVQPAIDIAPTLLDYFRLDHRSLMPNILGKSLAPVIESDTPTREAGIFGYFGLPVNVTDGKHVYMRAAANADNRPLNEYTMMPAQMRNSISIERLQEATLTVPFSYMKNCPPLRIPGGAWNVQHPDMTKNLLWDLSADEAQKNPSRDSSLEATMLAHMTRLMQECDAPTEQYERLGLTTPARGEA